MEWHGKRKHFRFFLMCICSVLGANRVPGSVGRRESCPKSGQEKAKGKQWAIWTLGQEQAIFSGGGMGARPGWDGAEQEVSK